MKKMVIDLKRCCVFIENAWNNVSEDTIKIVLKKLKF